MPDNASPWSREATWPPQPACLSETRRFVRWALLGHHLGALVDVVVITADELATNAVLHAGTPFSVRLERVEDHVVLRVADGSRLLPAVSPSETWLESGRGLHLVGELASSWGVDTDGRLGKSVWATFAIGHPHESEEESAAAYATEEPPPPGSRAGWGESAGLAPTL